MLTAIDQIANRNHLQIIKALIPCLPRERQKMIAFSVKIMELQNISRFFGQGASSLQSCASPEHAQEFPDLLSAIRDCCGEEDRQIIDQISEIFSALEMYSMVAETMSGNFAGFETDVPEESDPCNEQARGKNQSELLPFLMAASGKKNLKFSKDEMEAVISVLKIGKSPQEIRRIDRMYAIFKQKTKN